VFFGKVNTEEQPDLAAAFEIEAIPTLMVFRDRVLLYSEPGALPADGLRQLLTQVRGLDMDDIRRQIAEEEGDRESDAAGADDKDEGGSPDDGSGGGLVH
jgi:thioredoxin-like negative regulator of GroEL